MAKILDFRRQRLAEITECPHCGYAYTDPVPASAPALLGNPSGLCQCCLDGIEDDRAAASEEAQWEIIGPDGRGGELI